MIAKENPKVADLLLINWQLHYQDIVHFRPRGEITLIEYGDPMLKFFASRHPAYLKQNPNGLNWMPDRRDYISFIETFNVDYDLLNQVAIFIHKLWADSDMNFPNYSDVPLVDR